MNLSVFIKTTNLNCSFPKEKRAAQVGFEPTTYCLRGRCSRRNITLDRYLDIRRTFTLEHLRNNVQLEIYRAKNIAVETNRGLLHQ